MESHAPARASSLKSNMSESRQLARTGACDSIKMRVISGIAKGLQLEPVKGDSTRPILDRVKTPLFDILAPYIKDSAVLDMFAGTGGLGIEALSRGAKSCIFLDQEKRAIETINKNLTHTKLLNPQSESGTSKSSVEVRWTDAFKYLRDTAKSFDLIFIDPPQNKGIWLEALKIFAERPNLLNKEAIIAVKIFPEEYEKFFTTTFAEIQCRKYGGSMIVILKKGHTAG